MNRTCIYLRKSRADEELEKTLGAGETLIKHRKALLKYAKKNNLNIVEIKEEIVSGDSLFFRPKMLELLKEVEENLYSGVLVMDIDRLGRGGMKEQGTILETFKNSNTLIITPSKTYDLNNDIDEEITEFKTFFARRELKVINKRMQGGRIRSVENGNYIATNPPLGYDITFINKFRTLKINYDEAQIIKIIFDMYTNGYGANFICDHLNNLGYKTKNGNKFVPSSVIFIIKNPVYIGKITWKKKDIKKSKTKGKLKDTRTRDKSEWIISDGKHKPIIDFETFNKAQKIINNKYHIPYQIENKPINPVAGIAICGVCGKKLVMRPDRGTNRLMCIYKCGNVSTKFDIFEKEMLNALDCYLKDYSIKIKNDYSNKDKSIDYENQLANLKRELSQLKNQKNKLFDLLERGIYSEDLFLERTNNINSRINSITKTIEQISALSINKNSNIIKNEIITFKKLTDAYKLTNDVKIKNELLKELLFKIEYKRSSRKEDFELVIFPRILC